VEAGEYNEFFKATFREFVDPLATAHFTVEGTIEFSAILFVPGMAPFEQQARARPARRCSPCAGAARPWCAVRRRSGRCRTVGAGRRAQARAGAQDWMKKSRNIRLFVKRVFISDEFDDNLLPRYLGFLKGIVDSSDLPLNVSREILQARRRRPPGFFKGAPGH